MVWVCPVSDVPDDINAAFDVVETLIGQGLVRACATVGATGLGETLFKMCVGNRLGLALDVDVILDDLCEMAFGTFVVELADGQTAETVRAALRAAGVALYDGAEADDGANADAEADVDDDAPDDGGDTGCEVLSLGTTTQAYTMTMQGQTADLAAVQEAWEGALEDVFPYRSCQDGSAEQAAAEVPTVSYTAGPVATFNGPAIARPRVVILVFPGTNCEYDTLAAFERAGAVVETQIINNLTPDAVRQSAELLVRSIRNAQIVMLPGGFSGGDEPDGSAKCITSFFRAPAVTEAVRDLLQQRDGLMLGICNGFQALVKLGLVPYGDIVEPTADSPTLTYNQIGRHQSCLVRTRVASNLSPWLADCQVGDMHTVAISHGEGRFVAPPALLDDLVLAGQVATQYVDVDGVPSMDLAANPNGSVLAIEGITSPDGRVLGKMGHTERAGDSLYKNVPGNRYQPLFEAGVRYFQ